MNYSEYIHNPIKLVDTLIAHAIEAGASDIHLEPTGTSLSIRFRIDGLLCLQPPLHDVNAIAHTCARIEILAGIDGAKRRIAQDGKWSITHKGRPIDLRVSTFPSLYGPHVVVRILNRENHAHTLTKLGLSETMHRQLHDLLSSSAGCILIAGPTGSGKTTTMYAALATLNTPEKHIITLEDPVEYILSGVTQGHIHPAAGFTFEHGMRALLRQDPDVIMIGEMRDRQTAQIAIEAALTGHLVLSTVHTSNAVRVIMRLLEMKIEPFLINAAVTGVVAQRLARMLCQDCKFEYAPSSTEQALLAQYESACSVLFSAKGCAACRHTGYKGRVGIFELNYSTAQNRTGRSTSTRRRIACAL
jgi:type II secretory ATPase GspE/PulE/Tfp pilus assembly ATPase PilB-like protein